MFISKYYLDLIRKVVLVNYPLENYIDLYFKDIDDEIFIKNQFSYTTRIYFIFYL